MAENREDVWRQASRAILALAVPTPGVPIEDLMPFPGLRAAARYHGLAGEAYSSAVAAGREDLAGVFRGFVGVRRMAGMRMLSMTSRVVTTLTEAGIRVLVVKGLGLAAQTRANPMDRPSGDIDILIEPADLLRAHRVLLTMGATLHERFPAPDESWVFGYVVRLRHEATYLLDGIKLDLHWQLGSVRRLLPPAQEVLDRAVVVEVKGIAIPTLSLEDALLHSAVHWRTFGFQKLKYVADLQSLAAQMSVAELNAEHVFVRKVLAVSSGMRSATLDWQPTVPVPRRMWGQAIRALVPPDQDSPLTLRRRATSLVNQLNETPGPDRFMVPVRGAIGPVARAYQHRR